MDDTRYSQLRVAADANHHVQNSKPWQPTSRNLTKYMFLWSQPIPKKILWDLNPIIHTSYDPIATLLSNLGPRSLEIYTKVLASIRSHGFHKIETHSPKSISSFPCLLPLLQEPLCLRYLLRGRFGSLLWQLWRGKLLGDCWGVGEIVL